jgi:cyclopropane-fatty-acyl-phospholipid synthase
MNNSNIFLIVCILVIVIFLICELLKNSIEKYSVNYILGNFTKGNLLFVDTNNKEIFKLINDNTKSIPVIIIINENNFYNSVYSNAEVGLGESYMNGDWKSRNLIDMIEFLNVLCINMNSKYIPKSNIINIFNQNIDWDKKNIKHHYDVGNDFYLKFLIDDLSAYSCGFWFNETDTLNDAQYNKVNTIIKKMNAKPGKKILDIGCGWGKIANYVATKTGCSVTGITISDEQAKFGNQSYDKNKVKIINIDYRFLNEKFDYIYSIGMFEHVRFENYDSFFQTIKRCLNPNGRLVLHTIISFDVTSTSALENGSFVTKHIFPGGQIPNNDWIISSARNNGLNTIHFEGFGGQHYAKTLKKWRENMMLEKQYILKNYGNELLAKYEYYFAICEAAFNTGSMGIGHYIIVNNDMLSTDDSYN